MLTGSDYIFSESEEFRDMLISAYKKGINTNNTTKGDGFYQAFKSAEKRMNNFDSGQRLLKKIMPKYTFVGLGPLELIKSVKYYNRSKKQSNLEELFLKNGEDFTMGFLSNFYEMKGIFVTPFLMHTQNPNGLPDFSEIKRWKNKINYKEQYCSAIDALNKINSKTKDL